jgi:imidazole glycerol-phosphate synthase subunit HisH
MITIVDYGMGNLGSLINIFRRIGVPARTESDPERIEDAKKLILPGVGAFDAAMERIGGVAGLRDVLDRKALVEKIPVLGVCLGMQLLTNGSEEGKRPGLGWIAGRAHRFPTGTGLKVPHMGWNSVIALQNNGLTTGLGDELRYYFVHSYYVRVEDPACAMLQTSYGLPFDSGICRDNIFGLQFHPEKSHRYGMSILKNFARM